MRAEADFRCERCGYPEGEGSGHTLTVNPIIRDLPYIKRANLVVLCRRCQGRTRRVSLESMARQLGLFESSELPWLEPHLAGVGIRRPGIGEHDAVSTLSQV
jgi:hypothetical protein